MDENPYETPSVSRPTATDSSLQLGRTLFVIIRCGVIGAIGALFLLGSWTVLFDL